MQITFYFFNFIKYLNKRPLNFKLYVQVTAPWALIRERCLSKKILLLGRRFLEMGTYLRMGAKSSIYGKYYILKEECTQVKLEIAVSGCKAWFSPIVINDNRALLVFSTANDEKPFQ